MRFETKRHPPAAGSVVALALVATLAMAVVGCGRGDAAGKARARGPVVVRVGEARLERVDRVVELTGTLGGDEEVTVAAEVDGRVEKVVADLGDEVKPGGTLVQLASAEPRLRANQARGEYEQALAQAGVDEGGLDGFEIDKHAAVRRAHADLEEAKRNLGRGRELFDRNLAARGELEALETAERIADAGYQSAIETARSARATALARRAAWGLAKKKLDDTTIGSPVRGRVARRHVALGAYVRVGQPVADVVTVDPLKLRGEVAERYSGLLEPGMEVTVRIDAGGREAKGIVSRIGPAIAASSRTFPVEALVKNEDGLVKPGAFARAEIRLGADEEVVAVPETAVSNIAGVTKVFVEVDGKAVERPVSILRKRGSDALLSGDVKPGDRVILTGVARLFDGAPVQVDEAGPDAGATAGARE